jgi:predicted DNA-binding helix-hairpin-helix protein
MEQLNRIDRILRYKHRFKGYIDLKVIPGASSNAIEEAVWLSTAVSLNIETPGAKHLAKLSARKNFIKDIVEPIKLISRLTGRGNKYARVKQTTQFVVGAAEETDSEIVKYMWGLYDRLNLKRIYFSAYQKGLGDNTIDADKKQEPDEVFMREHRLYQVDFLLRKYGFTETDICFDKAGNLSLEIDPKEHWAKLHPEYFPVDINKATKYQLMRVPGLGDITVGQILEQRKNSRIRTIEDIGKPATRLIKANEYLCY